MNKIAIVGIVVGIVLLGGVAFFLFRAPKSYSTITSYEECVAAGYPVLATYPEQCKVPDGPTFVHTIQSDTAGSIHVTAPESGSVVTSPLTVSGEARGSWYFEGSFPVKLLDSAGNVLAQGPAQAQGDWMTDSFVPFKTTLLFNAPATATGTLILHNDNPSGIPANDKEIRIPVRFMAANITPVGVFGKSLTLRVGDKLIFSDGMSLALKEINDSRCKPNVQCIWAGELSFVFSMTAKGSSEEVRLGTITAKSATAMGYTVTLQSGALESVAVTVTAASPASGISGTIHVGPTCPVERMPPDPACADRPYANANVTVQNKANGAVAGQSVSDANGIFRVAVPPGTYTINVTSPTNAILPRCTTVDATVNAGGFTSVDVSCDSGIR